MHNKKIFLIFYFLIPSLVSAQENYLCVSEAIGGVAYNSTEKKWEGTKFKNSSEKIIITKTNGIWKYKEFGATFEEDCGKSNEYGNFRCSIFFGEFVFNSKTKRFIKTYTAGYVGGEDNNNNTPAIMIGTCSKF